MVEKLDWNEAKRMIIEVIDSIPGNEAFLELTIKPRLLNIITSLEYSYKGG